MAPRRPAQAQAKPTVKVNKDGKVRKAKDKDRTKPSRKSGADPKVNPKIKPRGRSQLFPTVTKLPAKNTRKRRRTSSTESNCSSRSSIPPSPCRPSPKRRRQEASLTYKAKGSGRNGASTNVKVTATESRQKPLLARKVSPDRTPRKRRRSSTVRPTSGSWFPSHSPSSSRRRPSPKRPRRRVSRSVHQPYRPPTPPRKRSPNYPAYGGLVPELSESVTPVTTVTDDKVIASASSGRAKSGPRSPKVCPLCNHAHGCQSILKRRSVPYPPPRQKGRRNRCRIRFAKRVKVRNFDKEEPSNCLGRKGSRRLTNDYERP